MTISIKRLSALSSFKFRELYKNKTFLITAIMVPGFTLAMRLVYENIAGKDMPAMMFAMVLNLGVLFNVNMISLMMPATMLAKDKEKNTLRTLMTSSVEGSEYFVSCILPSFVTSIAINIIVLLISGFDLSGQNLATYLVMTTIAAFTSCVIGMIVGLFAKNQMASSNLSTIAMLVFFIVPTFSTFTPSLQKTQDFIYTGIVSKMINGFAESGASPVSTFNWVILIVTAALCIAIFILCYKRNGFDKD